jgi:hypothetical protein
MVDVFTGATAINEIDQGSSGTLTNYFIDQYFESHNAHVLQWSLIVALDVKTILSTKRKRMRDTIDLIHEQGRTNQIRKESAHPTAHQ